MNILQESKDIIIFNCNRSGLNIEEILNEENLSGRFFRKLYKNKGIYINGRLAQKRDILKTNDKVSIVLEDEINNIGEEIMELDIVYEDYDILVINKDSNVVVHPTKSHQSGTLSNGISHYFKGQGINKKIRFVNRLDMNTSGLLIVAKNPFAHQQMALQFQENRVEKKYYAIVQGLVVKDKDRIDLPINREEEGSVVKTVRPDGQNALTEYKVIKRFKNATLLDVQIFTGRSHQIRVHLNHIGHPIIGDTLYGKESPHIERQALHSYYLKINNIRSKEPIELFVSLPKDMEGLIDKIR